MRVLFLIQGYDRPSSRYRVLQYLPYLDGREVAYQVITYPRGLGSYIRLYRTAGTYDVIFLQRKRLLSPLLSFLRWRAKRIVYDFDDAVMYRSSNASSPYSATRERRFARTITAVDHVIAGNTFLQEQARRYTDQVTIIPTTIDMTRYTPKDYHKKSTKVTIGWIGSSSTLPYLDRVKGVFEALGKRYNGIELKIIGDSFFDCKNISVVKKKWNEEDEIEDLKSLDIGVMPLSDDPWSRGKCGLKILQYYGVGVPVVCTPVGINRDVVQDGVNGFWAMTHEEWIEKLSILIEDPPLRQKMGLSGRELVGASYSLQGCAPRFYGVLDGVAQKDI
jgi:glycosyltransferase involved in cell wall biosynthesis